MKNYNNKIIWITGASSGIGKALYQLFFNQGARLILTSRDRNKLEEVVGEIDREDSNQSFILEADLSIDSDFKELCLKAQNVYGGTIDVLINNAGISQRSLAEETDIEVYRKLINLDYLAPVALTGNLLKGMIDNHSGHIVNISSMASLVHTPLRSGYSGAKAALNAYSNSLAAEVFKKGISLTTIIPGFINTGISINSITGHGEAYNINDDNQKNGMDSLVCGQIIINGMLKKKRMIFVGLPFKVKIARLLSIYFPSLLARILINAKVT